MKKLYQISPEGLDALKKREGLSLKSYPDGGNWPDGTPAYSIGYGHHGKEIKPRQVCTVEQAEQWLREDTEKCTDCLEKNVTISLTQSQIDALVSFIYNVGVQAFEGSTLLRKLNQGDMAGASEELLRWDYSQGKQNRNLLARRESERMQFLEA